jgi:hypothetical protein
VFEAPKFDFDQTNSYSLRGQEVFAVDVAVRRAVAVTAGVVWAALVSRFWWPAEARRELSKALDEFSLFLFHCQNDC